MQIEVLTPEKKLFSGEGKGIQMPGISGSFEVLDRHAPMIAALGTGTIRIQSGSSPVLIQIKSGFMECLQNKVVVLVEGAELLK